MAYSLLAHLYSHIRGSQEDIATYSLQYLLSQSNDLNRAYTQRLADKMQLNLEDNLQYICQVTGDSEEKERPDMVGFDSKNNEIILCEMKFYATLTVNQPLTYLDRLKNNNGDGLIFICPAARKTSLWAKLQELCNQRIIKNVNSDCIEVDGIKLAIITWTEIIELLKEVASATSSPFSSDIKQLEGYCNQIDSDAFIPFTADDLSADVAKKAERYYQVVDEVIELLCADKNIKTSKKGLKATAYRKGYTRSLYINDFAISFNYDRDLWKNPTSIETPFWVAIRKSNWEQDKDIYEKLKSIPEQKKDALWGMIFLALEPLQNATLSEVCENLKKQILNYIDYIIK